jgi:hypothetical protein
MNNCKQQCVYNEKSSIISIPQSSPTHKKEKEKENNMSNEYSLNEHIFDPSKSSPPNEFMLKLKLRMSYYASFTNDDKRNKE